MTNITSSLSLSWSEWIGIIILTRLSSPSERIYKSGVCIWRRLIQCGITCKMNGQIVHNVLNGDYTSLSTNDDNDNDGDGGDDNDDDNDGDNDGDDNDGGDGDDGGDDEVIVGEKEVQSWMESTTEEEGIERVLTLLTVTWNEEDPCIPLSSLLFLLKYVIYR